MFGAVMGRVDAKGAGRTGRTRWRQSAALVALMLAVASCGDDPGKPFVMPAGTEYDTVPGDRVIVMVESQNECEDLGNCVPKSESPCDLGDGNTRGLAVYRMGANGRIFSPTGDQAGALPEEILGTADNPRRVIAHPNDPTLLYVATLTRVQVFRLAAGGGSTCIDETPTDQDVDPDLDDDLEPVDLVIDPAFGTNGILYLAGEQGNRVDAYDIALDGTLPDLPSSCIVGNTSEEFAAITTVGDTLFATGSRDRIEIYQRSDGHFVDVQLTPTPTPTLVTPTPTPTPMPTSTGAELPETATETPTPVVPTVTPTPSPAPTCVDARFITAPLSSLGAGRVTDIEFMPAAQPDTETIGDLLVAEESTARLISFPVDPNGQLDGRDNGDTARAGFYQRILRVERDQTFIYMTAFQEGKTDQYELRDPASEEDRLFGDPVSKTRSDPFSLPVGLTIDGVDAPFLYVAQSGLHRIDGFRFRTDGGIDETPATSTAPVQSLDGRTLALFPVDLVIVPLP